MGLGKAPAPRRLVLVLVLWFSAVKRDGQDTVKGLDQFLRLGTEPDRDPLRPRARRSRERGQ